MWILFSPYYLLSKLHAYIFLVSTISWVASLLFEECLRRKNFAFSPEFEADLLFERNDLKKGLKDLVDRVLTTGSKAQVVFYGDLHSGKTHLLKFVRSKLYRDHQKLGIDIDLCSCRTAFDFYIEVMSSLFRIGFIDEFVASLATMNARGMFETTGTVRFNQAWKLLKGDVDKIRQWLEGRLEHTQKIYLPSNVDPLQATETLMGVLRAYFVLKNRTYPVVFIDHLELIFKDIGSLIDERNKSQISKQLSTVLNMSSFFVSIDSQCLNELRRMLYPSSTGFSFVHVSALNKDDVASFLSDIKAYLVNEDAVGRISQSMTDSEKITSSSYPLTEECEDYLREFDHVQPGVLSRLLDTALKKCMEKEGKYVVTRQSLVQATRQLAPELLVRCKKCKSTLKEIDVGFISLGPAKPGRISNVICPFCGSDVTELLAYALTRIVTDTSSLVGFDVSMLVNYLSGVLGEERSTVYVPKAVFAELSGWDKKFEKRQERFSAYKELENLSRLQTLGKIALVAKIGRDPTPAEIALAQKFNTIDRLIIEVAKTNDSTLLTHDNDMKQNSVHELKFTLFFLRTPPH